MRVIVTTVFATTRRSGSVPEALDRRIQPRKQLLQRVGRKPQRDRPFGCGRREQALSHHVVQQPLGRPDGKTRDARGLTPFDLTTHQRLLEKSRRLRFESIVASDKETEPL